MQEFRLSLSNGTVVTGLHHLPPSPPSTPTTTTKYRPLIIALHGGGYDSRYFDVTPQYSASSMSASLGVPFISIDRPSYGGTSPILSDNIPEGSDYFYQETGSRLHRHILPKLWSEFGLDSGCTCVVLLCHSLGTIGGIVTAALHAQDEGEEKLLYPLGGLIASGLGGGGGDNPPLPPPPMDVQIVEKDDTTGSEGEKGEKYALFRLEDKDVIMFNNKPSPGGRTTVAPEVLEQSERLNSRFPLAETARFADAWVPVWKEKWAAHVTVPVMFCLVEDDPFFPSDGGKEVENCARAFRKSVRVDWSLIGGGAPHCLEPSYWSQGWYARCFGFALECAASFRGVSSSLQE